MKPERNKPCHCGSGKKYKKCHLLIERKETEQAHERWVEGMKQRALDAEKQRQELLARPKDTSMQRMGMMPFVLAAALAGSAFSMPPKKR